MRVVFTISTWIWHQSIHFFHPRHSCSSEQSIDEAPIACIHAHRQSDVFFLDVRRSRDYLFQCNPLGREIKRCHGLYLHPGLGRRSCARSPSVVSLFSLVSVTATVGVWVADVFLLQERTNEIKASPLLRCGIESANSNSLPFMK